MSTGDPASRSLRDRKRRQVEDRIVEAAFALFLDRGFDAVTVEEIAQRADVGRTTFFRYFGDKQEVVFARSSARDAELPHDVVHGATTSTTGAVGLAEALTTSRRAVTAFCREAAAEPEHHAIYHSLVEGHPELADRHARKLRGYVAALETRLIIDGSPSATAHLAAQVALAVYQAAWHLAAGDADALLREATTAFDALQEVHQVPA